MKSIETRIAELERKSGARIPTVIVEVCFIPATEGRPGPGPRETMTIFIGKPEVPAS